MSRDQDNEFTRALEAALECFGVHALKGRQFAQLVKHYGMLRRWNQRINLTRITTARDAAQRHYAESLFGARFVRHEPNILDIGSGAGFPGIPLAVIRPDVQVTALEANQRKSIFLLEAKDELGLPNFNVVTARMEEFDWAGYEFLASRALDRAEAILPSVIERLSEKQTLMLYCGPELISKVEGSVRQKIQTHPIPESETRLIALFSPKRADPTGSL